MKVRVRVVAYRLRERARRQLLVAGLFAAGMSLVLGLSLAISAPWR